MGFFLPDGPRILSRVEDPLSSLTGSKSARLLQAIRRDMDIKGQLFRQRRRNEQVLSLNYQDNPGDLGGGMDWNNIRENALNLPYRLNSWYQAQATSKKLIVKINRDAGAEQRPGGPRDDKTGMWVGITLCRSALMGGFKREMKAAVAEVVARGTSVLKVGYHQHALSVPESEEAGKDPTTIVAEVLGEGDTEAKPGQDHAEIIKGLTQMLEDEDAQRQMGRQGVELVAARMRSHADMLEKAETDETPTENTRPIRRRVYLQQLRVGEDVGWAPWVTDTEDTPFWWERHVDTVAWGKQQDQLFSRKFRMEVEGHDGRNLSGVMESGRTPSTDDMGSDARQAQTDKLDDDERVFEWFEVYFRRPEMLSGGYRKIVCAEMPDEFIEATDENPFIFPPGMPDEGKCTMEGFYPYVDITPVLSTLAVPERTAGIPLMAVGMPHFEKCAEYNRLRQEAALKGATRLYQIHPGVKDNKKLLSAVQNGEIGYAFIAPSSLVEGDAKMVDAVKTIDFTSRNPEIEKQREIERLDFLNVTGMPPAAYQGMGTAETLGQDRQGISLAGAESRMHIEYMEERVALALSKMRGIIRGTHDDDDFHRLLGAEGAKVMQAWQAGTVDDGDEITVTFGAAAKAQETVEKKQLMEAFALTRQAVEPLTGQPIYDDFAILEELFRRLDVGAPQKSEAPFKALYQLLDQFAKQIEQLTGENPLQKMKQQSNGSPSGFNPSEGSGPTDENLNAGAMNRTQEPNMAGF